ncbi:MAG: DUF4878 domain-containing protein [Chloroflexi bacterium]|nr:DUF4878 domain-containing protein [Chloroflexota bacterium]
MKQDRFLIGILVFIVVLVAAALALFFIRQDTQAYLADDTPEGVVHNYALSLYDGDYERAYAYLADLEYKPDYTYFRQNFVNYGMDVSSNAIQVGDVAYLDGGEALVDVTVIYAPSGPFAEGWNSFETANLIQQAGAWKLTYMPYPYWGWDWYQETIEPVKP